MALSISPILPAATAQAVTLDAALQPGTVVSAQVLRLLDANLVRIAIANLTLDVATTLPLQPGQTLQLAVTQTRDGVSLAPLVPEAGQPRGAAEAFDDSSLAPRLPVQTNTFRPALSPLETRAVTAATELAATKQSSLAPLFANLSAAVPSGSLPQPVLAAAAQLLALRQPSGTALTGADIKAALQSSGLALEASLAKAAAPLQPAALPDIKAALTVLRQALATWIGASAATAAPGKSAAALAVIADVDTPARSPAATNALPAFASDQPAQVARNAATPPPFRDALPSAQGIAAPSLAPDAGPVVIAQRLIADTDGALARQTLLQIASLPDQVTAVRNEVLQPRWNFEVPFVTPQGTAMAQFAISRDGSGVEADASQRIWRARFSLDIEPAGPVHALISFSGDTTCVKMWAERPATAAQLRANAAQLGASLDRAELKAGDIVIADGSPARAKAPSAGHFVNRAS